MTTQSNPQKLKGLTITSRIQALLKRTNKKSIPSLVTAIRMLKFYKGKTDELSKKIGKAIKKCEWYLIQAMEHNEQDSFTQDGATFTIKETPYFKFTNKPDFLKWLVEVGLEDNLNISNAQANKLLKTLIEEQQIEKMVTLKGAELKHYKRLGIRGLK